jgi:hypothetical protein
LVATTTGVSQIGAADPLRLAILRVHADKWDNHVTLTYSFYHDASGHHARDPKGVLRFYPWRTTKMEMDRVREAFEKWKSVGIGLSFKEVQSPAEANLRIGFAQDKSSWSFLGSVAQTRPLNERTMNFGWSLYEYGGMDTALHEIGHALACPHEHQNPNSGIVWNEEAVIEYFKGDPNNWKEDAIRYNILRRLDAADVEGSAWDPNSVMHYTFPRGLIVSPEPYQNGLRPAGGLSANDRAWVRRFYPAAAVDPAQIKAGQQQDVQAEPGDQSEFLFVPEESRIYTFLTDVKSDTLLSLKTRIDGAIQHMAADDDSGVDRGASVRTALEKGKEYWISVRTRYSKDKKATLSIR